MLTIDREVPDLYLDMAEPEYREICEDWLGNINGDTSWEYRQLSFLKMVDRYISDEMEKPVSHRINTHEAGGRWRIAFPHARTRVETSAFRQRMEKVMAYRKMYTDAVYFHGYPDETESHHDIETFLYFQIPLYHLKDKGSHLALISIEDVAHHAGNWVDGIPDWYDWKKHEFRSYWLGTRSTRDYPPFDYQEANHFRIIALVNTAYQGTGNGRYLDFSVDYTNRWCDYIEQFAEKEDFIPTNIMPEGYEIQKDAGTKYSYSLPSVGANRAYDLYGGLIDMWRLTGTQRYLDCARLVLDQFFEHAAPEGYPPYGKRMGAEWGGGFDAPDDPYRLKLLALGPVEQPWRKFTVALDGLNPVTCIGEGATYLSRLALRHDLLTGEERYKKAILKWANAIDENTHLKHSMKADLFAAAHWYTGDPDWLKRGYAMALRTWAILEPYEGKMCGCGTRYSSKFYMELLYNPILGGADYGNRGNIPVEAIKHGPDGLPDDIAFRTWRIDGRVNAFEAVNKGTVSRDWRLENADEKRKIARVEISDGSAAKSGKMKSADGGALSIGPGQSVTGKIHWKE